MAEYKPQAIPRPPDQAKLLEVLRLSVPDEYWAGIVDHPSFALFRAMAAQWSILASKLTTAIEGRYYQDSALAVDYPATEARFARGVVTLERITNWEEELVLNPGDITLEIAGRRYLNEEPVIWHPGDHGQREAMFRCEVATAAGNLDHIAEADGTLDVTVINIADKARGRAGVQGYVFEPDILSDSGIDDLFAPEDVGLYVRITESSDAQNVGPRRKILGWSWPEEEYPITSGRFPRRVSVDLAPRQNAVEVLYYDGVSYTDLTEAATDEGVAGDVTPLVGATNRAVYFAHTTPLAGVVVDLSTVGVGDYDVVWEYWDISAAWLPLDNVVDPTNGWRPASPGEYTITWTVPTDLPLLTSPGGSGIDAYYVRARVSAHTSVTTQPVIDRAVVKPIQWLDNADATSWVLYGPKDLGVSVVACEAFAGGRDDDLYVVGADRGLYRQDNEDPETFRKRITYLLDTVSPNAINRAIDRAMAPYGLDGEAFDVGNGLTGIFADVDAFDYYGPGDAHPTDPWKLLLSSEEERLFFLVVLPYLVDGEFGTSFDDGPTLSMDGEWLGPAFDVSFMDGYPVDAYAAYAALWSTIMAIKMYGVGFAFTRDLSFNTLAC